MNHLHRHHHHYHPDFKRNDYFCPLTVNIVLKYLILRRVLLEPCNNLLSSEKTHGDLLC